MSLGGNDACLAGFPVGSKGFSSGGAGPGHHTIPRAEILNDPQVLEADLGEQGLDLFGLIPGPSRGKFHGKDHALLDQSIVDINKIYRSLFAVKGIIEAVHSSGYLETEAERTRTYPGGGEAFASEDTVALDAFATALAGREPESVGHLRLAAQTFGGWDERIPALARQSGISVFEF